MHVIYTTLCCDVMDTTTHGPLTYGTYMLLYVYEFLLCFLQCCNACNVGWGRLHQKLYILLQAGKWNGPKNTLPTHIKGMDTTPNIKIVV